MSDEPKEGRSIWRRYIPLLIVIALVFALVAQRLRDSEDGSGDDVNPLVSVTFPANVESGSVHTATVRVQNPGASDITNLFVSFSLLGAAGGEDLPTPILGGAVEKGEPVVVSVEPEPVARAGDVRFGFGELSAGEEMAIEFELRVPETPGRAANSVVAYDGGLTDRAGGARLETMVDP